MRRYRLGLGYTQPGGDYFPTPKGKLQLIRSGCTLLDCVLGGGWPLGRVVNIVGDKAVGKTLLAIEACANFHRQYPKAKIHYREAEAAFDLPYAEGLGLPADAVDFGKDGLDSSWETVEDIFEDLDRVLTKAENAYEKQFEKELAKARKDKSDLPRPVGGLYIIDSLDALSSRTELQRKIGEGSYNLDKQKQLGALFRQLCRRLKVMQICLVFISQVRDKIGITFGEKHSRSGGKAMDFYASQIVWLSHMKTLVRTVAGVKRATAVSIKAKCKKNKVGLPFRECQFTIRFGYGVDDFEDNLDWLAQVDRLDAIGLKIGKDKEERKKPEKGEEGKASKAQQSAVEAYLRESDRLELSEYRAREAEVRRAVISVWADIEKDFVPSRKKYT